MKAGSFSKAIALLLFFWLSSASAFEPEAVGANPDLVALTADWVPPTVYNVTDGVYVAVGFNQDNPVLIEGTDGLIVIDPGESTAGAEIAKAAFNEHLNDIFSKKPVKAIIYTHYHPCHIHGASVFAGNDSPEIIAHESLEENLFSTTSMEGQISPIKRYRMVMMGGLAYQKDPGYWVNAGIAPFSVPGPSGYLPPTLTVGDILETNIVGVNLTLVHAPGETADIIYVWMPDEKVIIQIGNLYKSFPAINTLRGASYRDPLEYIESIDSMRKLNAEYLVLIHSGGPVVGTENVSRTLTDARDGLQYVHDQTVRLMNQGLTAGEIIEVLELPPHLADDPYLQEYYGEIDRDIFQIFQQYLGWFTGETRDIFPTSPREEAEEMAYLAGGIDELLIKAEAALDEGNMKWALIFSDSVLLLDPENAEAQEVKNSATISLAEETANAQVRNYLLSKYLEDTGQVSYPIFDLGFSATDDNMVVYMPMDTLFRIMGVSLNATKALDEEYAVGLELSDDFVSVDYAIYVRKGIVEVQQESAESPKFSFVTDTLTWKNLALGKLNPEEAVSSGKVEISGADPEEFYGFMDLFK